MDAGVKRKWRLVRGRVAFARGGGGESRRENEEGATYPSLEESCLRFWESRRCARACVYTSFSFPSSSESRWLEDYSKDRITEVEGESFPSKGLPNLAPFYRVRFSFRFFASFFFFDRCLDLESSFGKYSRKRGWCNYWWEEWKGKGTENIGNTKRWWSRERDVNGGFTAHRLEAARRANGKFSDVIKSWPLLFLLFV